MPPTPVQGPSIAEILSFNGEHPDSLLAPFVHAARSLEPYEEFAVSSEDVRLEDHHALLELMTAADIFDEIFTGLLRESAMLIRQYMDSLGGLFAAKRYQELDRRQKRFDRQMCDRHLRLHASGRPLAHLFMREVLLMSYVGSLERNIRRFGMQRARELVVQHVEQQSAHYPRESLELNSTAMDWFLAAQHAHNAKPSPELIRDGTQAYQILRDSTFEATVPTGVCSNVRVLDERSGRHWHAHFVTLEDMHPAVLALFKLHSPNGAFAEGALSRINGGILAGGGFLLPIEQPFLMYGKSHAYETMRLRLHKALLQTVIDGKIRERSFVDETPLRVTPEAEEVTEENPIASAAESTAEAACVTAELPARSPGTKHQEWQLGRLCWPRIMKAFTRYGVEIIVGGSHPKLKYNGRVTRFLNSHERDTARNRHELFRALRELDIPRDTFFSVLR